jgi:hypothetical protein
MTSTVARAIIVPTLVAAGLAGLGLLVALLAVRERDRAAVPRSRFR